MTDDDARWGDEWDDVADVIVVGSGAAGLAAALTAASRELSVLLLERGAHPGGTTAKSSATMWIPNNRVMRALGVADERSDALAFMARAAYPTSYSRTAPNFGLPAESYELLEAFFDNGQLAFDEFADSGALPFVDERGSLYPDYYAEFPEDTAPVGRSIRIDKTVAGARADELTGGQVFVDCMLAACRSRGVELRTDHRVMHLVKDASGNVLGVEAHRRQGGTSVLGARRGIVFATGGFLHDAALAAAYLRGPVLGGAAAPTATGDFVRIGIEAGASMRGMQHAWWSEVVVEAALRGRSTPHDCVYPFGDSMIIVNRFGVRVMNEKMPYNERGQIHHIWDPTLLEYPNYLLFMLFDETVLHDHRPHMRSRYPVPDEGQTRENVISAESLPKLVDAIGKRLSEIATHTGGVELASDFLDHVSQTVARFGSMARAGVDQDFRRGQTMLEQAWSSSAREGQANPTMRPFDEKGPYHCILLGPGALDTKGGPAIDARARVLDGVGAPIPGLYAAGNCAGAPTGQAYYGPGGTVGPALAFGYIAGRELAVAVPRTPKW